MNRWATISYRDFWDVPRIFIAHDGGRWILFDCPFDETTEDYPDTYQVYEMPTLSEGDAAGSWAELRSKARRFLREVPVSDVRFDATKRAQVDLSVIDDAFSTT